MNLVYVLILIWGGAFLVAFGAFAVHLYRSVDAPQTPAGGVATPRTTSPTGPQQPDAVPSPPTRSSVRRRTVPPSDPSSLGGTVAPGWRMR